jgi:hypothetical protein
MSARLTQVCVNAHPQLKADQVPVSSQSDDDDHAPARDQIVWGQTPSGQGARVPEHTLRLLADTCLPQFSASRPRTMSSPPSSTRPTQNRTSTSSTSACSRSSSSSSTPCRHAPQDLLLSLFRVLARRVRRWAWIRVDQAEQAEMDRQDGTETRVAR